MFSSISIVLIATVVLAIAFDFINGFHDTANAIATSVSTRVLSPKTAIIMAAILNFVGALVSSKVAQSISSEFIDYVGDNTQYIVIATLISAIIWNLITWKIGIPSSSTHALIGALLGAAITFSGQLSVVKWDGVIKLILIPLVSSPILGFIAGYLFMSILFEILRPFTQNFVNKWFSKFQILSAALVSFEHGMNDAQKSMGIITLALIGAGQLSVGANVPFWVMISCALAMALGTSIGGWKIIKTVGLSMIKLQPIGGFAAQTGAAIVMQIMSFVGAPISTTHVISTSIMGVGASKRFTSVRWIVARNIVGAWILTIPVTAALGAFIAMVIKFIIPHS